MCVRRVFFLFSLVQSAGKTKPRVLSFVFLFVSRLRVATKTTTFSLRDEHSRFVSAPLPDAVSEWERRRNGARGGGKERLVRDETETGTRASSRLRVFASMRRVPVDEGMTRQELETEVDVVESGSVEDDEVEEVEVEEEEANPREIGIGTIEGVKRHSSVRDVARLFLSPYDEMDVGAVVALSESDETNEGERHVVISDERFVNDTFCIGCGRRATANLSRRIDHVVACDALAMKMCNLIRVGDVGETVEQYLRLVARRAGNGRTCKMDAVERLHQVCALKRALAWTRD